MTVCQICGDRGYSWLLINCLQCQNIAAHRYCIDGPTNFNDEIVNWLCEGCVPGETEPASPCRLSERLSSILERVAPLRLARKKLNSSLPPQPQAPTGALKEGASDPSIIERQKKDGSAKRKQSIPAGALKEGASDPSIVDHQKKDRSAKRKQSKPADALKETFKGGSDLSIVDQKNDGSVKRKQSNPAGALKESAKGGSDLSAVDKKDESVKRDQLKPAEKITGGQKETSKDASDLPIIDQKEDGSVKRKQFKPAEKPTGGRKETSKKASDLPITDQKKDGSVKRKQLKPTENPTDAWEETGEEACDLSIVDQKKDGSAKRKQTKPTEKRTGGCEETGKETCDLPTVNQKNGSVKRKQLKPIDMPTAALEETGKEVCDPSITDQKEGGSVKRKQSKPSEKRIGALKETDKGASDLFIVDHGEDGSLKRLQSKLKKNRTSVHSHPSDATEVIVSATGSGKGEDSLLQPDDKSSNSNSNNGINECTQEVSCGGKYSGQRKHSTDAKKGKKMMKLSSENDVKIGSSEAFQITGQKIKNMNSSNTTGLQQVKPGKNVGPLSEVLDHFKGSSCVVGNSIEGNPKLGKQQNLSDSFLSKKEDRIDESTLDADQTGYVTTGLNKSSCEVNSELLEESYTNQNYSQDAKSADNRNSGLEETSDFVRDQHADVQSNCDVSERQAPRKRKRLVIEMEYSDEEPVLFVAKHPQRVGDFGKDPSCKLSSEAVPKLGDNGLAQLCSVQSVPPRPSPNTVDDRVFDNDVPAQPSPVKLVNNIPSQPVVDAAWRGYCSISQNEHPTSLILEAHLSNKAHEKVQGAVIALPELLNFDFVLKKYAWPKSFERSPPTRDSAGLYFFPVDERDEKVYDCLVDKMIQTGLVLKSQINNLELLVFCSLDFPQEEWSFGRKYYLWGIFRPRNSPVVPIKPSIFHSSNVNSPLPAEYPSNCINHTKDLHATRSTSSSAGLTSLGGQTINSSKAVVPQGVGQSEESTQPTSTLLKRPHEQAICSGFNSSNTHISQDVGPSDELTPSISSLPLKQPHDQAICSPIDSSNARVHQEDVGQSGELIRPLPSTPLKRSHDQAIRSQINSSNTHVRQEDVGESDELTRPISSKPSKQPRDQAICSRVNSSNAHVRQEDVGKSDELSRPFSPTPIKQPCDQATCSLVNSSNGRSNGRVHQEDVGKSAELSRPVSSAPIKQQREQAVCSRVKSSNAHVLQKDVGKPDELRRPVSSAPIKQQREQAVCSRVNSSNAGVLQKDVGKPDELRRPVSSAPIKQQREQAVCSRVNSSNAGVLQKDVGKPDELSRPIPSMPDKRPRDQAIYPRINSSNTDVPQKNVGQWEELPRPLSLMPLKRAHDSISHQKSGKEGNMSYRKDYNRTQWRSREPREDRGDSGFSEYAERNYYDRKYSGSRRNNSRKWMDQYIRDSGRPHESYRSNR